MHNPSLAEAVDNRALSLRPLPTARQQETMLLSQQLLGSLRGEFKVLTKDDAMVDEAMEESFPLYSQLQVVRTVREGMRTGPLRRSPPKAYS